MTETTIGSDSHARFRAACPHPARDQGGDDRRAALAAGAAVPAGRTLFLSLSWLGAVPADAGHGALVRCRAVCGRRAGGALSAALLPPAELAEIDRRIERANRLEHNPVSVQSDRPSGHQRHFRRRAVARAPEAHGRAARRRFGRPAAHRAFRSAIRGRCAPRLRCSSSSPSPFRSARSAAASPTRFARNRRSTPSRRASTPG